MLRLVLKVLLGLALLLQAAGAPVLAKALVTKHACCSHDGKDTDSGPRLTAACPDCGDHCPGAMPCERTPPPDQADVASGSPHDIVLASREPVAPGDVVPPLLRTGSRLERPPKA